MRLRWTWIRYIDSLCLNVFHLRRDVGVHPGPVAFTQEITGMDRSLDLQHLCHRPCTSTRQVMRASIAVWNDCFYRNQRHLSRQPHGAAASAAGCRIVRMYDDHAELSLPFFGDGVWMRTSRHYCCIYFEMSNGVCIGSELGKCIYSWGLKVLMFRNRLKPIAWSMHVTLNICR